MAYRLTAFLQQYCMILSTISFTTVVCICISLRKMVFMRMERHIKAYFITLMKSLQLCASPPLITDHPNVDAVFLNICKTEIFKPGLILGALVKQAVHLKSWTKQLKFLAIVHFSESAEVVNNFLLQVVRRAAEQI